MAEPTYIYDAVLSFEGGVDSYTPPSELPKNTLAFAVNCTVRGDFVSTRSPERKINLTGAAIPAGLFQEAAYYQPDANPECLFASIGGRLIQFVPDNSGNAVVSDQTQASGGQNPLATQCWMWQAENFLIWHDGQNLPIFYDGSLTRRSLGNSYTTYAVIPAAPAVAAPAVGASVAIDIGTAPNSNFAQTVKLHGAYYSAAPYNPVGTVSLGSLELTDLYDTAGNSYATGTALQIIPQQLAVCRGRFGPNWTLYPLQLKWRISKVGVDYTGNFQVGQTVYIEGVVDTHGNLILLTVEAVDTVNKYLQLSTVSYSLGSPPPEPQKGKIISNSVSSPTTLVGTLQATFTAPSIGQSAFISLNTNYTGTIGRDAWLDRGHYLILSLPGSTTNTIVLTNLTDTPGSALAGLTIQSLPELPAGRMGTYGWGRNWQSRVDAITYLGGDIVGFSSGCPPYQYRDAVLKMTANSTLLTGFFRVPGGAGQITGMIFPAQLDTSLGQGQLQVGTQRGIFSCNAPIDTSWSSVSNPLQTESLKGAGVASHWSMTLTNADIFFKSTNAQLRSLLLARLDFYRWGDTPIGLEMSRIFDAENTQLLNYVSAEEFDNRLLLTATPTQGVNGVYHPDLVPLNFDPVSSVSGKSNPVYDGTWRGLNILKIVTGFFSGVQRTFAFCLNTTSNTIELWEIQEWTGDPVFDNGTDRVMMQFELPCFFNQLKQKSPFDLCRLCDGEIYADGMQGDVDFLIEYRPDFDQNWHPWASWTVKAGNTPTYQTRMGFGQPPLDDNNAMHRPSRDGYFFQPRVTITGPARVRGIRLKASLLPQPDFAPMLAGAQTLGP